MKLIINGICGQMGRTLARLAKTMPEEIELFAGVDQCGSSEAEGIPVYSRFSDIPEKADALIDFSVPQALPAVLAYCVEQGVPAVICTTGLGEKEQRLIEHASAKIPVFQSSNMSLGVNLQLELIKQAAAALGDAFDVEILERHHNRKVDSPSGTALTLANGLLGQYPEERELVFGRHSKNKRRSPREIGVHALRGGTIVGEHEVQFLGQDEMIEINHRAYSKQVFAAGAIRAAQYLLSKQPGVYSMHDIVTERDILSHLYTEDQQAVITLSPLPHEAGMLSRVFDLVAGANVFVDMISMAAPGGTNGDISFSLPQGQLAAAINALKPLRSQYMGLDIHAVDHLTKLTVEGAGMAVRHGVAAEVFDVLSAAHVSIELVTTSETKIACCIATGDVPKAVTALAKKFQL